MVMAEAVLEDAGEKIAGEMGVPGGLCEGMGGVGE